MNWENLCLQITVGRTQVKIQRDPTLSKSQVSLHSLVQALKRQKQGILLVLKTMTTTDKEEMTTSTSHSLPPSIRQMLLDFQDIFEAPMDLPPSKSKEHAINLQLGTTPISVRPYKYPQLQKNGIEILVIDMSQAGIIQPSSSPYSSPILLVKNKDGC